MVLQLAEKWAEWGKTGGFPARCATYCAPRDTNLLHFCLLSVQNGARKCECVFSVVPRFHLFFAPAHASSLLQQTSAVLIGVSFPHHPMSYI
jgi:hypothetical protein